MTYSCKNCRDTGKRVLDVADDGAVTHSEYLDCHHCEAASEIAAREAKAVGAVPELPPLPRAAVTYADHSYPAFSKKQMEEYARAALASSPALPEQGWIPIEAAPKDGEHVLLTNGIAVAEGHWVHQEGGDYEMRDLDGNHIGMFENEEFEGWLSDITNPTHWQPLPTPPAAKEQEKQNG